MRVRGGFTLIELIVGMFIATIAMAAGFGALGFVGERARHAESASVEALEGMATRELLVSWLSGALASAQSGFIVGLPAADASEREDQEGYVFTSQRANFQGLDAFEHALLSDELIFPTTAKTPFDSNISWVRLFIDLDPLTPEQGLVAELWGEVYTEYPQHMELLPSAVDMDIRYLTMVDGLETWSYSWIVGGLPAAVEISVWSEPYELTPKLLQIPVRVALMHAGSANQALQIFANSGSR